MNQLKFEKLENICTFTRGLIYKKGDEVSFSKNIVLRASNINLTTGKIVLDELRYISDEVHIHSSKYVKKGNILICTASGSKAHLGKNAYIEEDYGYAFGGFMGQLEPNCEVDGRYFYWFLQSPYYVEWIGNLSDGININNLKFDQIAKIEVPLMPRYQQNRIVAILDDAFARIDKAIENTEKNIANAKELCISFLDSIFLDTRLCGGYANIGSVANHCLGKMLDKSKNKGNPKQYLRNANIQWFSITLENILEMRFTDVEEEKYSVHYGDLLICEGGYPGRAAIWEGYTPMFFQKAIHRIRSKNIFYNKWIMYYLFYASTTGTLNQYFTGTGIQHFTGQALDRFSIPWPADSDVETKVKSIEDFFSEINQIEKTYKNKLASLHALKQSLLAAAFSGELTTDFNPEALEDDQ